ncbi:MAG: PHP domain-containing protein [bacterium]|nr:PHP domain-containing protein [bacterium]
MIDLHTHTTASDGDHAPAQVVELAGQAGLEALAITDHDTFAGYEEAAPVAAGAGLELVCAIELSTRLRRSSGQRARSVHLLGYFLHAPPAEAFRDWLRQIQDARRDRNRRMAERLSQLGVAIELREVEAHSRNMAGRPHFARVLIEKGYVSSFTEAFESYLGESAKGYVQRLSPSLAEGIHRIREAGGVAVLAHPIRLGAPTQDAEADLILSMVHDGLQGLEVFHSDHRAEDVARYHDLAERNGLVMTGGSDFHGDAKPRIQLGGVPVSGALLDELRRA